MGFFESDGSNDFASIFSCVAEAQKEAEEKKQTELLLRMLDELEDARPDESGTDRPRKEFWKVSAGAGDEEAKREKKKEAARRDAVRGKVHTLDDLPKDDFGLFFPSAPPPADIPEMKVETGRRLSDGKISYSVSMPGMFDVFDIGDGDRLWFFLGLLLLAVLVFGIFIGRITGRRARLSATPKSLSPLSSLVAPSNGTTPLIVLPTAAGGQAVFVASPLQTVAQPASGPSTLVVCDK